MSIVDCLRLVRLSAHTVHCAHGLDWSGVLQTLEGGYAPTNSPWPITHSLAMNEVYLAQDPSAAELGVDRKLTRTMEKQARMMLLAACKSIKQLGTLSRHECDEFGLYLGLPTVDEAIPNWDTLQLWHQSAGEESWDYLLLRETPPFSGLTMLNSSVAAHIAATIEITGTLAVYSPFADAGLNALIDGVLAVAEGECKHALIGAVSPKVDPLLALQYRNKLEQCWTLPLGEAATACVASCTLPGNTSLMGYARGMLDEQVSSLSTLINQALVMAELDVGALDGVLHTQVWNTQQDKQWQEALRHLGDVEQALPIFNIEHTFGLVGAAAGLLGVGLAESAFQSHAAISQFVKLTRPCQTLLLVSFSPLGQCVVVILHKESK